MTDFPNLQPDDTLRYFRRRGYHIGFDWRDTKTKIHAQSFTVAKAMELDILHDIREALDNSIANGVPFEQFKKDLAPVLKKKGWWGTAEQLDPLTGEIKPVQLGSARRLRTIYDANVRSAYAAGHWAQIQRSKKRRPYLRYVAVLDDKTRPEHRKWHGLIRPVDDPIWRKIYPPNGWHCRCQVQQLSERDLQRNGWKVSKRPDLNEKPWTNQRTGERFLVPEGVDPGWQENAGVNFQRMLEKRLGDRLEGMNPPMANRAIRRMIDTPEFKRLQLGRHGGSMPVGIVPDQLKDHLKTSTATVKFSDQTATKNLQRHKDLKTADYKLVNEILQKGEAIEDGDSLIIQAFIQNRWWRAVVKRTVDREEIFLTTFHRVTLEHVNKVRANRKIVRE